MERSTELGDAKPIGGILIRQCMRRDDHPRIPHLYPGGFGCDPRPSDWDDLAEFDPPGVFVAESVEPTTEAEGQ